MSDIVDELEQRLVRLEEDAYFQKATVDALNEALIGQQAQIDRLERKLAQLEDRVQELNETEGTVNTPPPHYQSLA